jgi:hypothetical protein
VLTSDLGVSIAPGCVVDHVVFLNRELRLDQTGRASVRRHSENHARAHWAQCAVLGTEEVRAAQRRCYERLLDAGLWTMQYSNLDNAVERLERLVDHGA